MAKNQKYQQHNRKQCAKRERNRTGSGGSVFHDCFFATVCPIELSALLKSKSYPESAKLINLHVSCPESYGICQTYVALMSDAVAVSVKPRISRTPSTPYNHGYEVYEVCPVLV
jgi:hypothetical protein